MNLLIIGNISSGKTSLSKAICRMGENFHQENYHAIDDLRREHSDGTYAGEFLAWSKMLEYMQYPVDENEIFEFSGTGKNAWFVREIIKQTVDKYKLKWLVIYCSCSREILLDRASKRVYDIPMPYKFGSTSDTINFMSNDIGNKHKVNYWSVEKLAIQTDKFPPTVCAKQILDKLGEPHVLF